MQYSTIKTLVFGALFVTSLFAEKNLRADEVSETELENKVKTLLEEGNIFEKADKMSVFIQAGDDSFYTIEKKNIESLVGERFSEDKNSLVGDTWTMEAEVSKNWRYSLEDDNERFVLRNMGLLYSDGFKKAEASESAIHSKAMKDLRFLGIQKTGDLK